MAHPQVLMSLLARCIPKSRIFIRKISAFPWTLHNHGAQTPQLFAMQGTTLPIVHAEPDRLWLETLGHTAIDAPIVQVQCTGKTDDILRAFEEVWQERWNHHQHVPQSQWNQILRFAHDHLPRNRFQWDSLDADSLAQCLKFKKKKTATGLDGISLLDLRSLPTSALQSLCDFFQVAEVSGAWPTQLLQGRVSPLAKTEHPAKPDDYRPITIFPLLYRCWGTWHARHAIRALDPFLSTGLYGSRPHRHAAQIWTQVLWCIEEAYHSEFVLSGFIADLTKAFNLLPREIVMEGLAIMGLPFPVLTAWSGALAHMQRFFQVHGSFGRPQFSTCGYPEGCALSCVAMILIDEIMHRWLAASHPLMQTLTFADDWQLLTADGAQLQAAFDRVQAFCEAIRVPIDDRKTHFWSTGSFGRAHLRSQGLSVAHHCRALGAHMQLTRQHTNAIQQQRVASLKKLWPRLKVSCSPYHIKIRAIKMAAWPRALHGVAATLLGSDAFRSLRSGAMQALQCDGAGVNPVVHLGLIEDCLVDPLFWSIKTSLRTARACGNASVVRARLVAMAQPDFQGPKNTITYTLLQRVMHLQWSIGPHGQILDHFGTFDLFQVGWAELTLRAELVWPRYVESQVSHRYGFRGLAHVHVSHTRKWLRTLSVSCRAAFVKILNGAHITQDGKKYCDVNGSPVCPWCQCEDSRFHRFWICGRFAEFRSSMPPGIWNALPSLPETLTSYGWSLRPSTLVRWLSYFASLAPPSVPAIPAAVRSLDTLHVFTDGSCVDQGLSVQRFASWAYLVADMQGSGADSLFEFSGVLPGLIQSAYRAESFAILQALRFIFACQRPAHLWCDCGAAVLQFVALLKGKQIEPNHPHSDLWLPMQSLLLHKDMPVVQITKVALHVSALSVPNAVHEWCCHNNSRVDAIAVTTNSSRGGDFDSLLLAHRTAVSTAHEVSRAIQQVQLQISLVVLKDLDAAAECEEGNEPSQEPPKQGPVLPSWEPLPPLSHVPSQAIRWYGEHQVRRILAWFWSVVGGVPSVTMRWVSFFQLFVDFQMATGNHGPIHVKRGRGWNGWTDSADSPMSTLVQRPFKLRARWFAKVWKECLRHLGVQVHIAFTRPDSHYLNLHCSCAAVPWPEPRVRLIDQWFQRFLVSAAARDGKSLQSLPLTMRNPELEAVVMTDVPVD